MAGDRPMLMGDREVIPVRDGEDFDHAITPGSADP
jgi:hypothetical protein